VQGITEEQLRALQTLCMYIVEREEATKIVLSLGNGVGAKRIAKSLGLSQNIGRRIHRLVVRIEDGLAKSAARMRIDLRRIARMFCGSKKRSGVDRFLCSELLASVVLASWIEERLPARDLAGSSRRA